MPEYPDGLQEAGSAFYAAVTEQYDLPPHALARLYEAARTVDTIRALDAVVAAEGLSSVNSQGVKAHWALIEARAQRLALVKILGSLGLPEAVSDTDADDADALAALIALPGEQPTPVQHRRHRPAHLGVTATTN